MPQPRKGSVVGIKGESGNCSSVSAKNILLFYSNINGNIYKPNFKFKFL